MTFANPLLLAGAGLIALPIVLHLIMRQKPKFFEFPAIRFIQKRQDANRRKLRLRHLLLLALRTAAILFLALAMARPSVKWGGGLGTREGPVAAVLVFDTSVRMEYTHQNRTRLEVAQEMGLWLLAQLPRDSEVAVLDSRPGPGAFQVDRGAAEHRIEMLDPAAAAQSLTAALDEALRLVGTSQLAGKEIYVFTDMARVAWPEGAAERLQARAAELSDVGIYLIDVGVDQPSNTALGAVRLSQEILASRSPLRIEADVTQAGPGGECIVELFVLEGGGAWQKRSEHAAELESGRSHAVDFYIRGLDEGTHQGYVNILGQDALRCDNRRYFTVEVTPPWRVLIAARRPADRYGKFLSEMLAPEKFRKDGRARFECKRVNLDELAGHSLDTYSAVCLVDPQPLDPVVWQKLANYAADGHGVAIFLGPGATDATSFNDQQAQELLPARLLSKLEAPEGGMYLAPETLEHPVLAYFRGLAGTVPWEMLAVFRYWQLGELATGVHVVVPYNTGRPAILERPLGAGRVVTVTTPVSVNPGGEPWNLLPYDESGASLILINGLLSHLVGSTAQKLNYTVGQTAVLGLGPDAEYSSYALSALDNPEVLEVRLTPDPKRNALMVTSTDFPGNYRVRAGGIASGVDRGFSVNIDPRQTELARIDSHQLADVLGDLEFQITRDRNELNQRVITGRFGRDLFPMLIVIVALALGLEHVVANRFYRPA